MPISRDALVVLHHRSRLRRGAGPGHSALMAALDDRSVYREILDRLADSCMNGQGQISSRRVVEGVWHPHVESLVRSDTPEWMRESAQNSAREMKAANDLLAGLDATERQTLARLLAGQFVNGVHEALVVSHEAQIPPFDEAYEGTPSHDFVGRLYGWTWPSG